MEGLIAALRDPRAYPHAVDTVELRETHISWVLLAGAFAYKIKKPVALGFLDFGTLPKREHFCREELRVNRRFAPSLYLDVVRITRGAEGFRVDGSGEPIEWAVRMNRFPDGALLAERVACGTVPVAVWRALGADLARLQQTLPRSDRDDPDRHGVPARLRDAFAQNFRQARTRLRERADIVTLNALEEHGWAGWRALELALWERYGAGLVREGHGDLHLGNIVILDGRAVPFDAIEFSAEFRWNDVINELGFLLMDCRARGVRAAGWQVLDAWLEQSADFAGLALLELFVGYRAMVRAKVALMSGNPRVAPDEAALQQYRAYIALAQQACAAARPWLAITCGVSGSGKSTLAADLCAELGAIRLRADVERKRLFGLGADADSRAAGIDIYTPEAGARTFERLAGLAGQVIAAGYPVVVDATFIRVAHRDNFRALAARLGVPFHVLRCSAPAAELRRRVAARLGEGADPSEADPAVLEAQLAVAEWPEHTGEEGVLDAGDGGDAARAALVEALRKA